MVAAGRTASSQWGQRLVRPVTIRASCCSSQIPGNGGTWNSGGAPVIPGSRLLAADDLRDSLMGDARLRRDGPVCLP